MAGHAPGLRRGVARSEHGRRSKKLIAWARWQLSAGPRHDDDELWELGDGIGPELGEAYCRGTCDVRRNGRCRKGQNGATHDCPAPPLLAENEPVVRGYFACNTQWRTGMSGRSGLDYAACQIATDAMRDRLQLPTWPDLLPGLQTIEHAMLAAEHELREREQERRDRERMSGR